MTYLLYLQMQEIKMKKRKTKELTELSKQQELKKSVACTPIPMKKNNKHKPSTLTTEIDIPVAVHMNRSSSKSNIDGKKIKKLKKGIICNSISNFAKEALGRGGGRACVATHGHGCCHFGILDLRGMDPKTYFYYSKDGAWLTDKVCMACKHGVQDLTQDKSTKNYLMYCEMGLKLLKFNRNGNEDEKISFDDHTCDMVLCVSCWNKQVVIYDQEVKDKLGLNTRQCSSRKKI